MKKPELRPYQAGAIDLVYEGLANNRLRQLLFAPTGAGKSLLIAYIIKKFLEGNKRILVLAHRAKLLSQLEGTISAVCDGQNSSFIMPKRTFDNNCSVQLGMVQSLATRNLPTDIDLILIDECHIATSFKGLKRTLDSVLGSIWAISPKPVIGLTATPWRTKKKEGLCWLFNHVIPVSSPSELIQQGFLTKPRVFTYDVGNRFDNTKVDSSTDDFNLTDILKSCTTEYNDDVIDKWRTHNDKLKTIWFCAGVKQAEYFARRLNELGYATGLILGTSSPSERNKAYDMFDLNESQILVSVQTLTEGFDQPDIECVVIARPTKSPALFSQMVGRGLRKFPGKDFVDIIDCGDCARWLIGQNFHGKTITEVFNITGVRLCPKVLPVQDFPTKDCPACGEPVRAVSLVCPHCGAQIPILAKQEKITMAFFPKLVELTADRGMLEKQYKFIRKSLKKLFQNHEDPNKITDIFYAKFKKLPEKAFFLGTLYGGEVSELYQSIHAYYLAVYLGEKSLFVHYMQLEFGEAYMASVKPFSPSAYLGLEGYTAHTLTYSLLDEAYTKLIEVTEHPHIVNFAYREITRKLEN